MQQGFEPRQRADIRGNRLALDHQVRDTPTVLVAGDTTPSGLSIIPTDTAWAEIRLQGFGVAGRADLAGQ